MSDKVDCLVTFSVSSGIFGVGRLATRLSALAANRQIGEWHIGHWVDWKHTEIRINFNTAADAALARSSCFEAATTLA